MRLLRLPAPVGLVNDFAGVLAPKQERRIERIIREMKAKSRGEIAVVTLGSLEGRTVAQVSQQIGREWGVSYRNEPDDPATNAGVVILIAPTEHRARIELATGANAFISNDEAGRILNRLMFLAFRRGDFGEGVL